MQKSLEHEMKAAVIYDHIFYLWIAGNEGMEKKVGGFRV